MSVAFGKMVKTRRPLGSLAGQINVGGEEALRSRVGPQLTAVERHTREMYERQEEIWRPLTRQRVEAFIRLFLLCFVDTENGRPLHSLTYGMLKRKLAHRIIPWIERRLVVTREERFWPISMGLFEELDFFMAAHLSELYCGHQWGRISHFYGEVKKQEERERRQERASHVKRVDVFYKGLSVFSPRGWGAPIYNGKNGYVQIEKIKTKKLENKN